MAMMSEIYTILKGIWYSKRVQNGKVYAVQRKVKGRLEADFFLAWQILYLERARDKAEQHKADSFRLNKTFTKYMSIWAAKYNKRVHKRNVQKVVPLVQRKLRQKYFGMWMMRLTKHNYMNSQMRTLRSIYETKLAG